MLKTQHTEVAEDVAANTNWDSSADFEECPVSANETLSYLAVANYSTG